MSDILKALKESDELVARAIHRRETMVRFCREDGHTWQEIADVLGIKKQAACRKYAQKEGNK